MKRSAQPFEVVYRDIRDWSDGSTPAHSRVFNAYKTTADKTWQLLGKELSYLGFKGSVTVGLDKRQFTQVGAFAVGEPPVFPGVIVVFESWFGTLRFRCDRHATWESNLYAIAITLKRLRETAKHGVADLQRLYVAWRIKPTSSGAPEDHQDKQQQRKEPPPRPPPPPKPEDPLAAACDFLSRYGKETPLQIRTDYVAGRRAYRIAAFALHPDRNGGSDRLFVQLQKLWSVIEVHYVARR